MPYFAFADVNIDGEYVAADGASDDTKVVIFESTLEPHF